MIGGFFRALSEERGLSKVLKPLNRALEIALGKFRAFCLGWGNGYLGSGSRIYGTKFIRVSIGCSIGKHGWVEAIKPVYLQKDPQISIGQHFSASDRLHIACVNAINIGDDCLFGSSVHITDHNHGAYDESHSSEPDTNPIQRPLVSSGPVTIGSRVWLGDNVTVVGPVSIGENAIVGANSVVTSNVKSNSIVAGVPAKLIKIYNAETRTWQRVDN